MKCRLAIFICVNLIFAISFNIFIGLEGWLNFEVAFFSFLLVLLSAYLNLKHKIKKEILKTKIPAEKIIHKIQIPCETEKQTHKSSNQTKFNFSNFVLGMQLSIGIFRVFAYAILVITLITLMTKEMFLVVPYLVGIGICLASVVALWYSLKH